MARRSQQEADNMQTEMEVGLLLCEECERYLICSSAAQAGPTICLVLVLVHACMLWEMAGAPTLLYSRYGHWTCTDGATACASP